MNFLAQEFNVSSTTTHSSQHSTERCHPIFKIEQSIDNSAISYEIKAAQERDRRNRDAKCRTILEQSNGGSDTHELLEVGD